MQIYDVQYSMYFISMRVIKYMPIKRKKSIFKKNIFHNDSIHITMCCIFLKTVILFCSSIMESTLSKYPLIVQGRKFKIERRLIEIKPKVT